MPQNFSRQNLRGRNFKGQDLTGANFSQADIRGADFSGANLKATNFSGAKMGLQPGQVIFLVTVAFFIATLLGISAGIGGFAIANFLLFDNIISYFIPGSIVFLILSIISILIIQKAYDKTKEVWGGKTRSTFTFLFSFNTCYFRICLFSIDNHF